MNYLDWLGDRNVWLPFSGSIICQDSMHSSCSDLCPPFCKCLSTDSISVSGRHLFLYFSPQVWVPSCPPCKPSTIQGVVNSGGGLAVQETWASHNFFLLILVAHLSFCSIRQMKYNLDLISPVTFLPSFMCITTREKQKHGTFGQHLICQEIPRAVVCGWENTRGCDPDAWAALR